MSRREFNRSGAGIIVLGAAIIAPVGARNIPRPFPTGTPTPIASDHVTDSVIPPGMLDPSSTPPIWDVEKDYATSTVVPEERPVDCTIKVYPMVASSLSAYSGVLRSTSPNLEPSHILVQRFEFNTSTAATKAFPLLEVEVRDINAQKFLLEGPEYLTAEDDGLDSRVFAHIATNGTAHAVLLGYRGSIIYVLRAMQKDVPPIGFLQDKARALFESKAESRSIEHDGELLPGYRWSYGPINIHPDIYSAPVCT